MDGENLYHRIVWIVIMGCSVRNRQQILHHIWMVEYLWTSNCKQFRQVCLPEVTLFGFEFWSLQTGFLCYLIRDAWMWVFFQPLKLEIQIMSFNNTSTFEKDPWSNIIHRVPIFDSIDFMTLNHIPQHMGERPLLQHNRPCSSFWTRLSRCDHLSWLVNW